jgi:hypothetical protein
MWEAKEGEGRKVGGGELPPSTALSAKEETPIFKLLLRLFDH